MNAERKKEVTVIQKNEENLALLQRLIESYLPSRDIYTFHYSQSLNYDQLDPENKPHMIITGLADFEQDIATIAKIKHMPDSPFRDIPIVVYTAHGAEVKEDIIRAGADAYIYKFENTPQDTIERIEQILTDYSHNG